jgi:hypothetical protein
MDYPVMYAKTVLKGIQEAHLEQRGDGLAASSLPLHEELDFFDRIAFQRTIFRVMSGAMAPEPEGEQFRSRAEPGDEASRLDVREVVDVQIEVGHGGPFRLRMR